MGWRRADSGQVGRISANGVMLGADVTNVPLTHMEPQLGLPGRHEGGFKSLGSVALLLGLA